MFRSFILALALASSTVVVGVVALDAAPVVNAAAITDADRCPKPIRTGGKIAQQTTPESISKMAGAVKPGDPGTLKLNTGCQNLQAPLPPLVPGQWTN